MSTTEQDMLKILIEELRGLNLKNSEDLIAGILEEESEAANADDRRPVQKRIASLIDNALKSETEG